MSQQWEKNTWHNKMKILLHSVSVIPHSFIKMARHKMLLTALQQQYRWICIIQSLIRTLHAHHAFDTYVHNSDLHSEQHWIQWIVQLQYTHWSKITAWKQKSWVPFPSSLAIPSQASSMQTTAVCSSCRLPKIFCSFSTSIPLFQPPQCSWQWSVASPCCHSFLSFCVSTSASLM